MSDIVIVSAARTPIGGLLGDFSALAAHQLGAVAIKAAVERAGITGDAVSEVLMGNCLMAGQGQAPARQSMRRAGVPDSTGAALRWSLRPAAAGAKDRSTSPSRRATCRDCARNSRDWCRPGRRN